MTSDTLMQRMRGIAVVSATILVAHTAVAEITAHPKNIKVTSMSDAFKISLHDDGKLIPAAEIDRLKVMVNDHDYDHMFDYKAANGVITIMPTDELEIGTYDLVVHANGDTTTIHADAPLSDLEGTIQKQAKDLGMTPAEYRRMMDIVEQPDPAFVDLNMPSVYFLGQTLQANMVHTNANRRYAWTVDGKIVQFGYGPHEFSYTFMDVGPYFVTYREYNGAEIVVKGSSVIHVVPEPPVPFEISENVQTTFFGPDGYDHYTWAVDGKKTSIQRNFEADFDEPGIHSVVVHAHSHEGAVVDDFRQVTYAVEVKETS